MSLILSLLSAAARAAIVLTALVGTASLATGLAFGQSALPMRVDGIMRQLPALASLDHRVDVTAPAIDLLASPDVNGRPAMPVFDASALNDNDEGLADLSIALAPPKGGAQAQRNRSGSLEIASIALPHPRRSSSRIPLIVGVAVSIMIPTP